MNIDLFSSGSTQGQKQAYPRLSRMARDLYTILAMSDEPERIFSSAGLMTKPRRGRPSARAIREAQCVKSWLKTGIVTSLEGTSKMWRCTPSIWRLETENVAPFYMELALAMDLSGRSYHSWKSYLVTSKTS
jgi:hypothetical protein